MPILFTLAIWLLIGVGLYFPLARLFWPEIIEGQLTKQSFVAHLIDSWMRGDTVGGFPLRFFVEPWHTGPTPWAEEVPLYHWIAAAVGRLTGMNAVHSGRLVSFCFGILLLVSVKGLARILFPATPPSLAQPISRASRAALLAAGIAPVLLIWMPGFQIYSSAVIPDLAMLAMIVFAYWLRLKQPVSMGVGQSFAGRPSFAAYVALTLACLLKYFAFFALLALFVFDWLSAGRESATRRRDRALALVYAVFAGLPTAAYLAYFILNRVPNPIAEYMGANGYGHLAGPFLLRLEFYSRFLTWVLIKNPTLILALCAVVGVGLVVRRRAAGLGAAESSSLASSGIIKNYIPIAEAPAGNGIFASAMSDLYTPAWKLLHLHTGCYFIFALVFASSFYVHDYYALPFILPVLFYACFTLSWLLNRGAAARGLAIVLIVSSFALGWLMSQDATFRQKNYLAASEAIKSALSDVPDRDANQMLLFASDVALPVLPILSAKAGWVFDWRLMEDQKALWSERLDSSALRGVVLYLREVEGTVSGESERDFTESTMRQQLEQWRAADPRLAAMKIVHDQAWPSEGRKGSAMRLVVLRK